MRWTWARDDFAYIISFSPCTEGRERPHNLTSLLSARSIWTIFHLLESFDFGSLFDYQFPTEWLDEADFPSFRQCMESYYASYQMISFRVLQALGMGLGVSKGSLTARCLSDDSESRLNDYSRISAKEFEKGSSRCILSDTDTGLFILFPHGRTGSPKLEYCMDTGAVLSISSDVPTDTALIITDAVERRTNGELRAGVHWVVNPDRANLSDGGMAMTQSFIVFSSRVNGVTLAGQIPFYVSPKHPAKYSEVTALEDFQQCNGTL